MAGISASGGFVTSPFLSTIVSKRLYPTLQSENGKGCSWMDTKARGAVVHVVTSSLTANSIIQLGCTNLNVRFLIGAAHAISVMLGRSRISDSV